jgi:hypothetical protein
MVRASVHGEGQSSRFMVRASVHGACQRSWGVPAFMMRASVRCENYFRKQFSHSWVEGSVQPQLGRRISSATAG